MVYKKFKILFLCDKKKFFAYSMLYIPENIYVVYSWKKKYIYI